MKETNTNRKNLSLLAGLTLAVIGLATLAPAALAADIIPDASKTVAAADTEMPKDVENVKATPGDGQITLSWDVATDNVGVKGYKIYYGTNPVVNDGDTYNLGTIDVGNKISYAVTKLTNGTKYYFAVTAYDAAGNESENYSVEVNATPAHAAADTEAPKVVKAEATYKDQVKVTFSEAVKLPVSAPENAFTVKNDATQAILTVKKAEMDSTDSSNKTVILTTATQQAGASYLLIAGIQVKDLSNNPIVSGTSDTGIFTGVDIEHPTTQTQQVQTQQTASADKVAPALANVTVPDPTHVMVTFSEPVVLSSTDPTQNFIITEEKDYEKILTVKKATQQTDQTKVLLETDSQKPMNYNLIVMDVKDKAGNAVSMDGNATVFFGGLGGTTPSTQQTSSNTQQTSSDTTPPEDATDLIAKLVNSLVHLTWTGSLNSAGDLSGYTLYKSTDGQIYESGITLDPKTVNYDFSDLIPGMRYFFKLTARDSAGNESAGVVTTFTLPKTGPELGLLLLGSLGLGKLLKKRKK